METSEVRRRVLQTIERARRQAAARRGLADAAAREYAGFLERIAVPLFRQIAQALKAEGYVYDVFTPGGSVRLVSERHAEDFIELSLDTTGPHPMVMGRVGRSRGRRHVETEHPVAERAVRDLTDEEVLGFVLKELEAFVER